MHKRNTLSAHRIPPTVLPSRQIADYATCSHTIGAGSIKEKLFVSMYLIDDDYCDRVCHNRAADRMIMTIQVSSVP